MVHLLPTQCKERNPSLYSGTGAPGPWYPTDAPRLSLAQRLRPEMCQHPPHSR